MTDQNQNNQLAKPPGGVPMEISLGPSTTMDLSWLSESERKALLLDHAKNMIDIQRKAQELHVDAAILKKTLDDLSDATRDVAESGNSVTMTHTQTTKVGRTEVMMGNTQQAQTGKLSKSQTGERDWTPYYVFGGIFALILIAAVMNG